MTIHSIAPGAVPETSQHRRLVEASHQFEAIFLQQLLKPMSETGDDGKDPDEGGGSTWKSFGTESLAKAISSAGGLGVARHIVEQVDREAVRHEPPKSISGQR